MSDHAVRVHVGLIFPAPASASPLHADPSGPAPVPPAPGEAGGRRPSLR